MSLADVRESVAAALRVGLDPDNSTVAPAPIDAWEGAPGFMVAWADPMLVVTGFCAFNARLLVHAIGPRIDADNGTAIVESLVEHAATQLAAINCPPRDVAAPGPFEIGGVTYLGARITIEYPTKLEA